MNDSHIIHLNRFLLEGLANHEERALQRLYQDYFPMICRMVLQNQGNEDDAKDLFQEAVMVLYERSKDQDFILACRVKTYLYAVGHRLWLKQLQQRRKRQMSGCADEQELEDKAGIAGDIEEHLIREERFQVMDSALEKLGEPCKSLLESFYVQQLSMQDIAEKFGYTNPDNAKTQKYKCLNRLKKIFFDQYNK